MPLVQNGKAAKYTRGQGSDLCSLPSPRAPPGMVRATVAQLKGSLANRSRNIPEAPTVISTLSS